MENAAQPQAVAWRSASQAPADLPQDRAWLDAFWGKGANASVSPSAPDPRPPWPFPEPGTLFLLVLSAVTALWQRIGKKRPSTPPEA